MASASLTNYDKWRFTLYTTLVLIVLLNPWTYIAMNTLFSRWLGPFSSKSGCPTWLGFVVHVILFTLVIRFLMDLHI